MTLRYEVARDRTHAAVALHGELDILAAPELRHVLGDVLDEGATEVVLDVGDLEFMDSSGLGVLVGCHRRLARHGGRLRIVGAHHSVARVLAVTGLDRVFQVEAAEA